MCWNCCCNFSPFVLNFSINSVKSLFKYRCAICMWNWANTNFIIFSPFFQIYGNCGCSASTTDLNLNFTLPPVLGSFEETPGTATQGVCFVDCMKPFYLFLMIMCLNKFLGGTEVTSNFLVGIRCVEDRDKAVSISLNLTILSIFTFIPSPIFFGYIIDKTCILWGKMCSGTGNCWLYDAELLRYSLNYTAAAFIVIGTMMDVGTWYYAKDVKIFDDEVAEVKKEGQHHNYVEDEKESILNERKLSIVLEQEWIIINTSIELQKFREIKLFILLEKAYLIQFFNLQWIHLTKIFGNDTI